MTGSRLELAGRSVGDGAPCYVIAEAGSNHGRDLDRALRLIDVAADQGADAVKFQTYSAESLYSRKTPMAGYLQKDGLVEERESLWDLIKRIELPRDWHLRLARHCRERGVHFLSTPFDERAVDELAEAGVPALKIASFEITHLPLLRHAGKTGLPVILSTGMADLGDIERALDAIGHDRVVLLHCAIAYPPRFEDLHLRAIATLRQAFGLPVGFSDHTMGHTSDVAAVALGACVIEKHFTLDRTLPGPDQPFALEPDELGAMVEAIRQTEAALGSPRKRATAAEAELYRLRRGLVAACDIPAGTSLTTEMIAVKRPGTGIAPHQLEIVVGRTARRDIQADDILTWDMV